jgi:hypothetical protein
MKAVVTRPFDGAVDGTIYPRRFAVGDVVEGDLARVAVAEKWAAEDEGAAPPAPVEIPENWESFNAADSIALARTLGADESVKTKAAAVEFIAAEVEKRRREAAEAAV